MITPSPESMKKLTPASCMWRNVKPITVTWCLPRTKMPSPRWISSISCSAGGRPSLVCRVSTWVASS